MQVRRISNDLMGAEWFSQEADSCGGSHFLHQGGGKHKQNSGIVKAGYIALSLTPQLLRKLVLQTSFS